MVELNCHRVVFRSRKDESAFFSWISDIEGVLDVAGAGDSVHIKVHQPMPDESLRELLAVFCRYDIDMTQLAQFASQSNVAWFAKKNAYWHNRVFPQSVDS